MKQFYSFSLCLSLAFGMATAATPTVAIMKTKAHAEVKSTKLSAVNSQRTVLSQKEMAPGIVKRLVRDKEGYVYADMIKNGVVSKGRQNIRPWVLHFMKVLKDMSMNLTGFPKDGPR